MRFDSSVALPFTVEAVSAPTDAFANIVISSYGNVKQLERTAGGLLAYGKNGAIWHPLPGQEAEQKIIGIRPGEKLHEQMIGVEDAPHTFEYKEHFKILPAIHNWSKDPERIKNGKRVPDDFMYSSDNNTEWMSAEDLSKWINENENKIGLI